MTPDERKQKEERARAYYDQPFVGLDTIQGDAAVAQPLKYIAAQTYFIRRALERIADASAPGAPTPQDVRYVDMDEHDKG